MASIKGLPPVRKMEKIKISASWDLGVVAMDPNHTIRQLKEKIHRKEGFPIERLRIHAKGIECPDYKTLRECEISDCTEVRAELLKSRIPLKVVVVNGAEKISVEVEVDDLDHISKLRYILEEIGFPIPKDHIFLHNDHLIRKDETFRWHRVNQGDKIIVSRGFYVDEKRPNFQIP